MNQILMVENKKKKKSRSGPIDIASSVKFFAIALIIFGIFFIGKGSYAIYENAKANNTENMPVVHISRVNDTAIVTVNSVNTMDSFIYSWNTGEETKVLVDGTEVEESIILPVENSVLNIKIEEATGRVLKYQKEFIIEGLDISQPKIEIVEENAEGNIKITATDETQMSYITYKINEEDEIRIDKSEIENKTMNYVLKLPRGENKVVVTAIDTSGNKEILEKTVIVSEKSSINLSIENGKLIIIAEDPDGVKDIEINLNGQIYSAKDINQKAVRIPLDIVAGKNTVRIKITNVNSLVTVGVREFEYGQ